MDLLFKDRNILITGASKGIGLACAKILAGERANIIISSRSEENLSQALREIDSRAEINIFPADVSNSGDLDALSEFVKSRFGHIDGLIINTGGPPMGSALSHPDEDWRAAFDSLLMPAVRMTRHFVPQMQERGFGRIVCISSTGVKQPIPGLVLSNSLRQAVTAFLKTLSNEVAGTNVFINSLLPGSTNTGRLASLHKTLSEKTGKSIEDIIAKRKESIPAGRFAEPENLAVLAAFLLSERNAYITGQCIAVDGGLVSFPL
ncbi:MAG: SDR family oxidoreductase [Bacteroidales bacterium]